MKPQGTLAEIDGAEDPSRKNRQSPYDYMGLLGALKRQRAKLCIWIVFCLAVASAYLVVTPPEYTAYTQVILEAPKRQRLALDADGQALPMDSAQADSRIQVIKSERLLRFVFDTLKLDQNIGTTGSGPKQKFLSFFSSGQGPSLETLKTRALLEFMDRVAVRRVGLSYVLEISYRAPSAPGAARMVNAVTAAYIRDLVISGPSESEVLQRRISDVARDAKVLTESVQAGTIPDGLITGVDARVISAAIEPLGKSSPHALLALLFAGCLGLTTGLGLVIFLHNRDRVIRSERQARLLFGPNLLATLPADGDTAGDDFVSRAAFESLFAVLPSGQDAHLSVGIVSWRSPALTERVASGLAAIMADSASVTLLSQRSQLRDIHMHPALPNADDLPNLFMQTNQTTADDHMASSPNPACYEADFERKAKGWLNERNLRDLTFDRLRHAGHLVMNLPAITGSGAVKTFGHFVDGVVLVIEGGESSLDEVTSAFDVLRGANINVFGVVFGIAPDPTRSRSLPQAKFPGGWLQELSTIGRFATLKPRDLRS